MLNQSMDLMRHRGMTPGLRCKRMTFPGNVRLVNKMNEYMVFEGLGGTEAVEIEKTCG
jgi:hypothetical protein